MKVIEKFYLCWLLKVSGEFNWSEPILKFLRKDLINVLEV